MPYNTRRKSLSLPSLGIHLPVTNAARAAAKSLSQATAQVNTNTSTSTNTATSSTTISPVGTSSQTKSSLSSSISPPLSASFSISPSSSATSASTMPSTISPKRSAPDASSSSSSNKRVKRRNSSSTSAANTKSALVPRTTPPSSPKRHASVEADDEFENDDVHAPVDMDGVVDDVVEGVIELLQSSGNRPHLIKELENHLKLSLKSVQQSANPQAIICSRLSSFMKRTTWNATRKCPLAKQLENIHPRRTYYYLTTCRHQPLPDASSVHFIVPRTSIATPPMSSAPSSSVAAEDDRRRELSPSPEVDLSSPGLDDFDDDYLMPSTPNALIEYANSYARYQSGPASSHYPRQQRGASPPLERDEKEFTQTAEGLQKQKNAGNRFMLMPFGSELTSPFTNFHSTSEAPSLFGHQSRRLVTPTSSAMFALTSPTLRPTNGTPGQSAHKQDDFADFSLKYYGQGFGWDSQTEHIGLDELDSILDF